jgi:hypothetical protein
VNAVYNPLGCYDVTRFNYDQKAMIEEVMSVFNPAHVPYVYRKGPRRLEGKTYSIQTRDGTFVDLVRESPVDKAQIRFRRKLAVCATLVAVLLVAVLLVAWIIASMRP